MSSSFRIGQGIDVHPFVKGRALILGGVTVPCEVGLDGHSDGDVLTHALMDAVLGACGKKDIGHYFPNTDPRFKGANSIMLLREVVRLISSEGWKLGNADLTLLAERPRIAPYVDEMVNRLTEPFGGDAVGRISIKATTTERLGFVGREEGIVAHAVVLMERL